jgi:RNA polymerase-associated protein RTF1
VTVPNRQTLTDKISDINGLVKRSWTDQEIREKLDRQNTLKLKFGGFERERLNKELRRARDNGDVDKMTQLQDGLDKLETPRLAFKTSLTPTKKRDDSNPSGSGEPALTQQDRLALVNAENRRRNQEEVRKAQLKERARARDLEARIERGEAVEEDTSRRLKTRAKFVHDVNELREPRKVRTTTPNGTTVNSGTSTPATTGAGTPRLGALNTTSSLGSGAPLLPHLAKLQQARSAERKAGIPVIHKPLTDDDFIGALDLDIDVEID